MTTSTANACRCAQADCVACFLQQEGEVWRPSGADVPTSRQQAARRFQCARIAGRPVLGGAACAARFADCELVLVADGRTRSGGAHNARSTRLGAGVETCGLCPAGAARAAFLTSDGDAASAARAARRAHAARLERSATADKVRSAEPCLPATRSTIDWAEVDFGEDDREVHARLLAAGHTIRLSGVAQARRRRGIFRRRRGR